MHHRWFNLNILFKKKFGVGCFIRAALSDTVNLKIIKTKIFTYVLFSYIIIYSTSEILIISFIEENDNRNVLNLQKWISEKCQIYEIWKSYNNFKYIIVKYKNLYYEKHEICFVFSLKN